MRRLQTSGYHAQVLSGLVARRKALKHRGLDEFAMPSEDWMTVSLRAGAGERQEVPEDIMELQLGDSQCSILLVYHIEYYIDAYGSLSFIYILSNCLIH